MSFKKMRRYGKDPAVVAAALRSSELLEVSVSGKAVRRREPLKAVDHSELRSRTLLITGLPDKSSIGALGGKRGGCHGPRVLPARRIPGLPMH